MHTTFTKEPLNIDDVVVYLKNERTGSSTIRKCKFIGQVIDFDKTRVKIRQFSKADQFVTPEEIQDYGEVLVYPHEIVHIIISKSDNSTIKTLEQTNRIINKYKAELEFTRKFIHEHGMEFELASAWNKHLKTNLRGV